MIDFKEIAQNALGYAANLVPSWCPNGKRSGPEWVAPNPTRSDNSAGSFKVNLLKGTWKDFATGDGGADLISLLAYIEGMPQLEAAQRIEEILGGPLPDIPKEAKGAKESKWEPLAFAPREAKASEMEWQEKGRLANWWAYRDEENRIIGYVRRFEDGKVKKNGKIEKQIIPLRWCRNKENGNERFISRGWDQRPIFNIGSIQENPTSPILLVEGEKCAQEAAKLIGDRFPVITWQGGGEAVEKVDWSKLAGKTILVWPDSDKAGITCAKALNRILSSFKANLKFVVPRPGEKSGWDVADFIQDDSPTAKDLLVFMNRNSKPFDKWEKEIGQEVEEPQNEPEPMIPEETNFDDSPFRCLGHNKENFYYLPRAKGQIVSLSASGHNSSNFMQLAQRTWWETEFPGKRGPSWSMAAERLIWENFREGIFTPEKIRGRGAWIDGKDIVIHKGDSLVKNGQAIDPVDYRGGYIYERGLRLQGSSGGIASKEDGIKVLELCKMFPWKSDVMGVLAAGWAFLAPICGVLPWRPHIWITGEAGSGKTWFKDNVLKPFVDGFGMLAQGSTTAAGVRQTLSKDSLPVLFDEAESNDRKSAERIGEVLELMRQSSMPGESAIFKGGANGESSSYVANSMFGLVSIVTTIQQQADEGRISLLELKSWDSSMERHKGRKKKEHFGQTSALVSELFSQENSQIFRNRAFKNIVTIKRNIEIFRDVCADHFGNQRAGDQIGTLLAGAFCLASDNLVSREKALAWLNAQDWKEQAVVLDSEKDQEAILRILLQEVVIVQTRDGRIERNIESLISAAIMANGGPGVEDDSVLTGSVAHSALKLIGINASRNPREKYFDVEFKHTGLDRILKNTPWSVGYAKVLQRVEGAEVIVRKRIQPSGKMKSVRLVRIPAEFIADHPELSLKEEKTNESQEPQMEFF